MMPKRFKLLLKIGGTIAFLLYLQRKIDLKSLLIVLQDVDIRLYLFSLILMLLNSLILSQKYRLLMAPAGFQQPLLKLLRINLVCRYYSTFLSAPVGQGVVRWHLTTEGRQGRSRFAAVMAVERAGFLAALLTAAAAAMLLVESDLTRPLISRTLPLLLVLITLLLVFHAFLVIPAVHRKLETLFLKPSEGSRSRIQRVLGHLSSLLSLYAGRQRLLGWGIVLSLVWHAVFILRVQLLAESISLPFGLFNMAWMASLVLLFQVLPVSFSGIGLRESAYAYLFSIQDVSPEKGVLLGVLLLSQVLFLAALGALLQWRSTPPAEGSGITAEPVEMRKPAPDEEDK